MLIYIPWQIVHAVFSVPFRKFGISGDSKLQKHNKEILNQMVKLVS